MAISKIRQKESYFSDNANTFSCEPERKEKFRSIDSNANEILFVRRNEFEIPLEVAILGGYSKEVKAFVLAKQRIESIRAYRKITQLGFDNDPAVKKEALGVLFTMANSQSDTIAQMGLKGLGKIILRGDKNTKDAAFEMLSALITMDYGNIFNTKTTEKKELLVIKDLEETRSRVGVLFIKLLEKGNSELSTNIKEVIKTALIKDIIRLGPKKERSKVIRIGEEMFDAAEKSKKRDVKEFVREISSTEIEINQNENTLPGIQE
jgi:hypothetical protein